MKIHNADIKGKSTYDVAAVDITDPKEIVNLEKLDEQILLTGWKISEISTSTTAASNTIYIVDSSSELVTVSLPTRSGVSDFVIRVILKEATSGAAISSSDTLDGTTSITDVDSGVIVTSITNGYYSTDTNKPLDLHDVTTNGPVTSNDITVGDPAGANVNLDTYTAKITNVDGDIGTYRADSIELNNIDGSYTRISGGDYIRHQAADGSYVRIELDGGSRVILSDGTNVSTISAAATGLSIDSRVSGSDPSSVNDFVTLGAMETVTGLALETHTFNGSGSAGDVITITHGLENQMVMTQVYDDTNTMISPTTIKNTTTSTVELTFSYIIGTNYKAVITGAKM